MHDCHPQYASTAHALTLPPQTSTPCSIIARIWRRFLPSAASGKRPSLESALTVQDMGTTGPSGAAKSLSEACRRGFERVAHLRQATLPGGDAAAQYPVQAAAGFLSQIDELPDLTAAPFQLWSALSRAPRNSSIRSAHVFDYVYGQTL